MGQNQPARDQQASVLRRKTQSGKADHLARAMSVPKALRLTLARVADDIFGMAMAVIGARMELRVAEALEDVVDGPGLLLLLDGPTGARGAVVLDQLLVGALIQQQTMGRVLPDHGGGPRKMTATDAAICAPFIDALLSRAAVLPETEMERGLLEGFRFGARAEDARQLLMVLDAPEYQVVHLTVDIAGGQRQAQMTLCLPPVPDRKSPSDPENTDGSPDTPVPETRKLTETVLALNVDLNIALTRLSMPLSAVSALRIGDILSLGDGAFDQARVLTMGGRRLARGTLGQIDGMRALRLDHTVMVADRPKRRADDRAELDQPDITAGRSGSDRSRPTSAAFDLSDGAEAGALAEMPEMSDLPGLDDLDHLDVHARVAG